MKKNMYLTILIFVVLILLLGGLTIFAQLQVKKEFVKKEAKYSIYDLLIHTIDPNPEQTQLKAVEEYKIYPPLRPERFRRKVKILWGIDINDYPDNSILSIGGYLGGYKLTLSRDYQLIDGFLEEQDDHDQSTYIDHEKSIYPYVREYAFINEPNAKEVLLKYTKKMKDKYFGGHQVQGIGSNSSDGDQGVEGADFFFMLYHNTIFGVNPDLMKYNIDLNSPLGLSIGGEGRTSDIRLDVLTLFVKEELAKGKMFKSHEYYGEDSQIWLGFNPYDSISAPSPFCNLSHYPNFEGNEFRRRPWHNYTAEKGMCSFMNFVLQLKNKSMNKFVIKFMSYQEMYFKAAHSYGKYEEFIANIKSNSYYGYAILREFCENPMREMPTLEKIGTNFIARVKDKNTLLLLEPFADSFDIDTVQPNETFKAYEMGHDDYYFIEIEKPVESPVADRDGYAMILDRKETVYGYLPKKQVIEYTSQDVLQENTYMDKSQSKRGVINDKDGYVNIRKEPDTQSEIVGKIRDKEIFNYWPTYTNWYIIETKDGIRGYVYKDRIREKYETEGWVIDE